MGKVFGFSNENSAINATSTITFTLANANGVAVTGANYTDTLTFTMTAK